MKQKKNKLFFQLTSLVIFLFYAMLPRALSITQMEFSPGQDRPDIDLLSYQIDASQSIEASPETMKELMLDDGTVISLASDSGILLDSESGSVKKINLDRGSLRVNAISTPVTVTALSCVGEVVIRIEKASAIIDASPDGTLSIAMVYGRSIVLDSDRIKTSIIKPGYGSRLAKNESGQCSIQKTYRLAQNEFDRLMLKTDVRMLALASLPAPSAGSANVQSEVGVNSEQDNVQTAEISELKLPPIEDDDLRRPKPVNLAAAAGFGPGESVGVPDFASEQASQSNGDTILLLQSGMPVTRNSDGFPEGIGHRSKGRTLNRVYSGESFVPIGGGSVISPIHLPLVDKEGENNQGASESLSYLFFNDSNFNNEADEQGNPFTSFFIGDTRSYGNDNVEPEGPIIIRNVRFGDNSVYSETEQTITEGNISQGGGPFEVATHYRLLTVGFSGDNKYIDRKKDNFLFLQASQGESFGGGFREDVNSPTRYFFATGDVDERLTTNPENGFSSLAFSVDKFFISSGINNCSNGSGLCSHGLVSPDEIRSFGRKLTDLGIGKLEDTGLLLLNQANEAEDSQTALLQVDFALNGQGQLQLSTLSATIGQLRYDTTVFRDENDVCNGVENCTVEPESIEVSAFGKTIGSSRGNTQYVGFVSPFRATAAGGGNPRLNRPGYVGYLVLENYDPTPQYDEDSPLYGGLEETVGDSDRFRSAQDTDAKNINYAQLRLATADGETSGTGGNKTFELATRSNINLNGWAAGLANRQSQSGVNLVQIDTDLSPGNFTIATDAATNRAAATLKFYDPDKPGALRTLEFGGLSGDGSKGASAMVDDDRFAARTLDNNSAANAALISSGLVKNGLPEGSHNYEYIQWGFFFGDTASTTELREHVHMGTWVAGEQSVLSDLLPTGTASYSGHSIGEVYNAGSSYTAVGSFKNTWDFGTRRGEVQMDFDNTAYTGQTQLRDNSVVFDGRLEAIGREGALHGNFVQGGGDHARGVIGRFSIQNAGGDSYRASGTFAAEKIKTQD